MAKGGLAGDRVLAAVAGVLRGAIHTTDKVFRFGGEEPVLLLPHQRPEGAAAAGERLRRCLEAAALEHLDNEPGIVTLSFGGAVFDPDAVDR